MIDVYINLIINILCLIGYIYLAAIQFVQMRRDNEFKLLRQRRLLMSIFIIAIITIIPVIEFSVLRILGESGDFMRQIANIMSPINRLVTVGLIIVFVNSRVEDE